MRIVLIRFNSVNGFVIQFAPANCFFTVFTVKNYLTSLHTIVLLCSKKDSITALTKITISSYNFKRMTAVWFLTNNTHNFLPFNTMWLNIKSMNMICDKMCGFVAGSVVDECVTVGMKHFIVKRNFVAGVGGIPCTATFQLEADGGQVEIFRVKLRCGLKRIVDSVDRFGLKFSHGLTITPCTSRARKKVRFSQKNNA